MPTLYITEYSTMGVAGGGQPVPIAGEKIAGQTRSLSGTSAQSNAFKSDTRFVRLNTDTECFIEFGSSPTATTSSARMPADATEYFTVRGGDKVAAITAS